MTIAFPKKLPDMPKGNWKAGLKFAPRTSTPEKPKKEKTTAPPKKKKMDDLLLEVDTSPPLKFAKPTKTPKKAPKPLKRTPLPPPTKPIAQMGKKRKDRILNDGSETDMNLKIWNTRPQWCEQCGCEVKNAFMWTETPKGEKVQKLIRPECFAHKLAKGMYPQHRLNPDNIALVCSFDCHALIDVEWSNLEMRRLLDEELTLNS